MPRAGRGRGEVSMGAARAGMREVRFDGAWWEHGLVWLVVAWAVNDDIGVDIRRKRRTFFCVAVCIFGVGREKQK